MKKVIYTILLTLWMIMMFMFSAQTGTASDKTSGGITGAITQVVQNVFNIESSQTEQLYKTISKIVRKTAHFTAYALGGILAYCTYNSYKKIKLEDLKYIVIFMILYAISDEIHQYFVPGRSAEIRDVLIDVLGANIGILIINKIFLKLGGKNEYKNEHTILSARCWRRRN